VEAVTVEEPMFLPSDVDEALALVEFEAGVCKGCGQSTFESWDPRGERHGWWTVEAIVCHACAEKERLAAANRESGVAPAVQAATRYVVGRREVTHG
jgi:hypothetical protein